MSQLVEIKAGPELDMAVAKAIGKEPGTFFDADMGHYWSPSTDLSDAFAAAEAAFRPYIDGDKKMAYRFLRGRRWLVEWNEDDEEYRCALEWDEESECYVTVWRSFAEGLAATPALAICAAILKLPE